MLRVRGRCDARRAGKAAEPDHPFVRWPWRVWVDERPGARVDAVATDQDVTLDATTVGEPRLDPTVRLGNVLESCPKLDVNVVALRLVAQHAVQVGAPRDPLIVFPGAVITAGL